MPLSIMFQCHLWITPCLPSRCGTPDLDNHVPNPSFALKACGFKTHGVPISSKKHGTKVSTSWMVAIITNYHASYRDQLTAWNKLEFGHIGNKITKLNQKLQVLEHHPIRNDIEIQEVRATLNRWLDAENTMWHHTSFFH